MMTLAKVFIEFDHRSFGCRERSDSRVFFFEQVEWEPSCSDFGVEDVVFPVIMIG